MNTKTKAAPKAPKAAKPVLNPIAAAVAMVPAKQAQDSKMVTDGITIEKGRDTRHGITRPSKGGVCAQVWLTCEALEKTLGRVPDRSEAISACVAQNVNKATAATQYMLYRRFNGVTGRLPKVEAPAAPEAAAA